MDSDSQHALGESYLRERGDFSRSKFTQECPGCILWGNVPGNVYRVCLEKFYRRGGGGGGGAGRNGEGQFFKVR